MIILVSSPVGESLAWINTMSINSWRSHCFKLAALANFIFKLISAQSISKIGLQTQLFFESLFLPAPRPNFLQLTSAKMQIEIISSKWILLFRINYNRNYPNHNQCCFHNLIALVNEIQKRKIYFNFCFLISEY